MNWTRPTPPASKREPRIPCLRMISKPDGGAVGLSLDFLTPPYFPPYAVGGEVGSPHLLHRPNLL